MFRYLLQTLRTANSIQFFNFKLNVCLIIQMWERLGNTDQWVIQVTLISTKLIQLAIY